MLLSAPRPVGASGGAPHTGRLYASPAEQEAMFAQLRARVGGPEATEADWTAARARSERRQRALDAYIENRCTPDHRATRPPPRPSRQYTPALPTTPARDQRLCPGAVRTLLVIRAAIGRDSGRVITRAYLARTLGYSERTAQRHISTLRRLEYITTQPVMAPNGRQLGQRIRITPAARPFWQAGEPDLSPLKPFPINGASKEYQRPARFSKKGAYKGVAATPERRPPSG